MYRKQTTGYRIKIAVAAFLLIFISGCGWTEYIWPQAAPKPASKKLSSPNGPEKKAAIDPSAPPKKIIPPTRPPKSISTILVVGDSISVGLGMAIAAEAKDRPGLRVLSKGKESSGLNSPRFYNWNKHLEQFIKSGRPDVVVVSIGGNDAHNGSGSAKWAEKWSTRLKNFLHIALDKGLPVYLVELPPMKKPDFNRKVKKANKVMRDVCSTLPDCTFVETWPLVAAGGKSYVKGKKVNGRYVTLRTRDGAHFTFTGYRVLGREILDEIDRQEAAVLARFKKADPAKNLSGAPLKKNGNGPRVSRIRPRLYEIRHIVKMLEYRESQTMGNFRGSPFPPLDLFTAFYS